ALEDRITNLAHLLAVDRGGDDHVGVAAGISSDGKGTVLELGVGEGRNSLRLPLGIQRQAGERYGGRHSHFGSEFFIGIPAGEGMSILGGARRGGNGSLVG